MPIVFIVDRHIGMVRDEIKSSGKHGRFAILYSYNIGEGRGSGGTFGKINVQDSIFAKTDYEYYILGKIPYKIERGGRGVKLSYTNTR